MDGSGYNDPDRLKAARELAQSFKGSSKGNNNRSKGGSHDDFKRAPSFTEIPRPRHAQPDQSIRHSQPRGRIPAEHLPFQPAPSKVPPPSRRNYIGNVLVSSPSKLGSGPVMGNKAVDFLCRQDRETKSIVPPVSQITRHDVSSSTPLPVTRRPQEASPLQMANGKPNISRSASGNTSTEMGPSKLSNTNGTSRTVSQSSKSAEDLAGSVASPIMTEAPSSRPVSGLESAPNGNILDTLFSFLGTDLGQSTNDQCLKSPRATPTTANGTSPLAVPPQPVQQPTDFGHSRPVAETAKAAADTTLLENQVGEETTRIESKEDKNISPNISPKTPKTYELEDTSGIESQGDEVLTPKTHESEDVDVQKDEKLSPNTHESIPDQASPKTSDSVLEELSPTRFEGSKLSAEAPEWTSGNQSNGQDLSTQYSDHIVPTGQSSGHFVSVTPVQFADGILVPGPSTGQLWLQTPVNVSSDSIPSNTSLLNSVSPSIIELGTLGASPLGILSNPVTSTIPPPYTGHVPGPKKPTKGLKASMWAQK
ncbi:hypothetical protein QQX98_006752 [Neonectria punicea]|uniref:Uncharacterized protein n=1 Tax=Neonectria punicea TaxID=979145 RepID=A0ABR1GZZ2_9HYPO